MEDTKTVRDTSLSKEKNGICETASGFVRKLYQMVNGAPDDVISWLPEGDAFRINNLQTLESTTLPSFFRHSRFQSLVRQLNFYNFRKVNRERNFWVYRHPLFHRNRPENLHLLKRRSGVGVDGRKPCENGEESSEDLVTKSKSKRGRSGRNPKTRKKGIETTEIQMKTLQSESSQVKANDDFGSKSKIIYDGCDKRPRHPLTSQVCKKARKLNRSTCDRLQQHQSGQVSIEGHKIDKAEYASSASLKKGNNDAIILLSDAAYHSYLHVDEKRSPDVSTSALSMEISSQNQGFIGQLNGDLQKAELDLRNSYVNTTQQRETDYDFFCNRDDNLIQKVKSEQNNLVWPSHGRHDESVDDSGRCLDKSESANQALVVSQVASQLRAYAKQAAEVSNICKVGQPKRLHRIISNHDLTYDDEIDAADESDEILLDKFDEKSGTIVTDDSDNSEEDDSALFASNVGKHGSNMKGSQKTSSDDFCEDELNPNGSCMITSRFHVPPMCDLDISNSIKCRILQQWVADSHTSQVDNKPMYNNDIVSAAISCFCMNTAPMAWDLEHRLECLIRSCHPLAHEFDCYLLALVPPIENQLPSTVHCDVGNNIQSFKIFMVNWIENLLRNDVRLNEKERLVLHSCMSIWKESTVVIP